MIACIGSARRPGRSSRPRSCTPSRSAATRRRDTSSSTLPARATATTSVAREPASTSDRRRTTCRRPGLAVVRRAGGPEGDKVTDRPRASRDRPRRDRRAHDLRVPLRSRRARSAAARPPRARGRVPRRRGRVHVPPARRLAHAPAGTLVVFPPGVVHGFDNDSGALTRAFQLPHAVVRLRRLHARAEPRLRPARPARGRRRRSRLAIVCETLRLNERFDRSEPGEGMSRTQLLGTPCAIPRKRLGIRSRLEASSPRRRRGRPGPPGRYVGSAQRLHRRGGARAGTAHARRCPGRRASRRSGRLERDHGFFAPRCRSRYGEVEASGRDERCGRREEGVHASMRRSAATCRA